MKKKFVDVVDDFWWTSRVGGNLFFVEKKSVYLSVLSMVEKNIFVILEFEFKFFFVDNFGVKKSKKVEACFFCNFSVSIMIITDQSW